MISPQGMDELFWGCDREDVNDWAERLNMVAEVRDLNCRNPTLAKCGGEAQRLEKLEVRSLPGLPNVQSSIVRGKTPRIGVFLVSLERSQSVDV